MPPDKAPDDDAAPVLGEALDRLYGAAPEDFTRIRKELATALKTRGELAASRRVMEAQKPTRAIWALNQVARRAPEVLTSFVAARAEAQGAQHGTGDAGALRASLGAYRQAMAGVIGAAESVLREAGSDPGPAERRQITESLEAAGADTSFLRARLLGGRLGKEAAVDPLAALSEDAPAVAPRMPARSKPANDTSERAADEERAAREREERERLAREERARRERAVAEAQREVASLEAVAGRARERVGEAEARLRAATEHLEESTARLEAARGRLRELARDRGKE